MDRRRKLVFRYSSTKERNAWLDAMKLSVARGMEERSELSKQRKYVTWSVFRLAND